MNLKSLRNMKSTDKQKLLIISLIALAIVILDQIIKYFVVRNISLGESIPVISNIFHLTYIQNSGAGFGLFQGRVNLLIFFSIVVIGIIFYYYDKIPESKCIQSAVAAILGGTLANLIDRISLGYVIDFIDFRVWPTFNIADMAITIGVITLVVYLFKKDMTQKR